MILDPFIQAESALAEDNVALASRKEAEQAMKENWRPFTDFINLALAAVVHRSPLNPKNVSFLLDL